ncbi:hypothetical protein HNQ60_005305 [Povalibacter uvarum]|uniref:Lipoprotein n=1 Tax=Povalibacter uvarum TaxID=732238 RepID=A0A841HU93_9GAMM|nr:hypothetical protein [Povalibacter uvarum]MBB6096383.1 hypothetical protein [Povalibacter uvarum]
MSMRKLVALFSLAVLGGCATTAPPTAPRQYLDEQTAVTVTTVATSIDLVNAASRGPDRWRRDRNSPKHKEQELDLIELHGVDVNRMGTHVQYLAVLKWLVPKELTGASPELILKVDSESIELRNPELDVKRLGMSQPLGPSFSSTSQWWYFPMGTATLAKIGSAGQLSAQLTFGDQVTQYMLTNDGRAQLVELTKALPR